MPFLQSLQNLFGGNASTSSNNRHQARRSVMNSTIDAFSLPTSSYAGPGAGIPEADSASSSPGPSRRNSTSNYTSYPPARETYQHSSSSSALSRNVSLMVSQPALTAYPPLSNTYYRLRNTLASSFPELLETLNTPVDSAMLQSFESELGCPLPPPVRDSLLLVDGQDLEAANQLTNGGLFYGLYLLPLEEVMREWAFWRQAEHDPLAGRNAAVLATMASVPPTWIKSLYACRGWIPLLSDRTGNYVGVDLDPGPGGSWGQVIVFGRDFDRKCVLYKGEGEGGWGKWLSAFVDEVESGDGWEADKSHSSSDEEDEVGYQSYTGTQNYGEAGKGLRLAGEYRGWNVLEAWWDRSVRVWEGMGLGLDVEEVERGLKEARKLAGYNDEEGDLQGEVVGKGKGKEGEKVGLGIGVGLGTSAAQVEIPVLGSPQIPHPGTPTPHDSDVLLPPASPDQPLPSRLRQSTLPSPSPARVITPLPINEHPLSHSDEKGFLSPPARSPPRSSKRSNRDSRRVSNMPAPIPLDLPTRADVQAMSAIHSAEASGLRGGWVMNFDPSGAARRGTARYANGDDEMEDIDLGGKKEYALPRFSDREMTRQREEEKRVMAGIEVRRGPSPNLLGSNSPTGFRSQSPDPSEATPRAFPRSRDDEPNGGMGGAPPSIVAVTSKLRRPPPIANHPDISLPWSTSTDDDRDKEVLRTAPPHISASPDFGNGKGGNSIGHGRPISMYNAPRVERELSTTSIGSDAGLLDGTHSRSSTTHSRSNSPPLPLPALKSAPAHHTSFISSPVQSPANMYSPEIATHAGVPTGSAPHSARSSMSVERREGAGFRLVGAMSGESGLEEGMEEIKL